MIITIKGIDKNVNECVNKAQIAINDWQCSGDDDFLTQASAELRNALDWLKIKEAINGR